ncbi:hypothetical protein Tsubulata_021903 [Turnera subulata]|uniref:Uncharacterized protein n=1 Tax=Turnera subulata TaxID=218843 RepID=A0A9Q0FZQ5_9ROSI|nr:hypothetical protein Tsubulata_021903 [Turnera subulata]
MWYEELKARRDVYLQNLVNGIRLKSKNSCPSKADRTVEAGGKRPAVEDLLGMQESEPEFYTDKTMLVVGTEISAVTLEWAIHPS